MAQSQETIGVATMTADGTIVLDLRAEGPDGLRGDARLLYPPSHPQYQEILSHLGVLHPGGEKVVPPWGEDEEVAASVPPQPLSTGSTPVGSTQGSTQCPSCGATNPAASRFCNQCGTALGCPSCGAANPPGSHFCNRCGHRLAE
jgi:predicted RNA-binding Zn-ribbon protein involved in translation (DUF1610 family)